MTFSRVHDAFSPFILTLFAVTGRPGSTNLRETESSSTVVSETGVLGFPFLVQNLQWVSPFRRVVDSSIANLISRHRSRSTRIQPRPHISINFQQLHLFITLLHVTVFKASDSGIHSFSTSTSLLPHLTKMRSRLGVVRLEKTLSHSSSLACKTFRLSTHLFVLPNFPSCIQFLSTFSFQDLLQRPSSLHSSFWHFSDTYRHLSALPMMAHPAIVYVLPMPMPGSPNAPHFKGQRVSDFLDSLETHAPAVYIPLNDLSAYVLCYFHRWVCNIIDSSAHWIQHDWRAAQSHLIDKRPHTKVIAQQITKMGKVTRWHLCYR